MAETEGLTRRESAEELGVSPEAIRQWLACFVLSTERVDGNDRITRHSFDRLKQNFCFECGRLKPGARQRLAARNRP